MSLIERAEFLSKQLSEEAYPERRFSLLDPVTVFRSDSHRGRPLDFSPSFRCLLRAGVHILSLATTFQSPSS